MNPNPIVVCGGPVPGGGPCAHCQDDMPVGWVLSGEFVNNDCTNCDEQYEGLIFGVSDTNDWCLYSSSNTLNCSPPNDGLAAALVCQFEAHVISVSSDHGPLWTKARVPGDPCDMAHTLTLVDNSGSEFCTWPETVTITPHDSGA